MISVSILNSVIGAMCVELNGESGPSLNWRTLSEEELFHEATICAFSSQMLFELAVAMAGRLRENGFFDCAYAQQDTTLYKQSVISMLSEPIELSLDDNRKYHRMPRFKNRLASFVASNMVDIYGAGRSFCEMLGSSNSSKEARLALVHHVWGLGPKQSSLFLRRVGYCSELAVLDTHILDYLNMANGHKISVKNLGNLLAYESIETEFSRIAERFGFSVGCVDFAMWLTMRVAKKETQLWAS